MIELLEEIAASLKVARKKKNLSQRDLSDMVGIPQSHISKIEMGMVDLQISSLIHLARALDLEPVLVSKGHLSFVQALEKGLPRNAASIPMYRLSEEEVEE
jgi:HTH-type transcriptional regulator/antitoxin HipB